MSSTFLRFLSNLEKPLSSFLYECPIFSYTSNDPSETLFELTVLINHFVINVLIVVMYWVLCYICHQYFKLIQLEN